MDWFSNNLPLFSGVIVPLLGIVASIFKDQEAGGRDLKRIVRYAQLRSMLEGNNEAIVNLDTVLVAETEKLKERALDRINRKVNVSNLFAIFFVLAIGAVGCFFLVNWAQVLSGVFAALVWLLFFLFAFFIIMLVSIGGFSNFYKK